MNINSVNSAQMQNKIKVVSFLPPFIANVGGQTYTNNWLEIPADTQLSDLEWVKSDLLLKIEAQRRNRLEAAQKRQETAITREIRVLGSTNKTYIVAFTPEGIPSCNCTGFGYRRHCRHIDIALKRL